MKGGAKRSVQQCGTPIVHETFCGIGDEGFICLVESPEACTYLEAYQK